MDAERRLRPETVAVKAGRGPGEPGDPLGPPLVMASNFHAGAEREYARTDGTPTWRAFEEAIGELEGGDAIAFSTGMATAAAVLDTLPVGARVVYPTVSYLGVRRLMDVDGDSGRLDPVGVDITDTGAVIAALDGADLLWIETPTNPMVGIADLERLAAEAGDRGITTVMDNTFATPLLQRPLEAGCDVAVHSATKLIGGHSDPPLAPEGRRQAAAWCPPRHRRYARGTGGVARAPRFANAAGAPGADAGHRTGARAAAERAPRGRASPLPGAHAPSGTRAGTAADGRVRDDARVHGQGRRRAR